jgi:hypothetical protein
MAVVAVQAAPEMISGARAMTSLLIGRRIPHTVPTHRANRGHDVHPAEGSEQLRLAALIVGRRPTAWAELQVRGLLRLGRDVAVDARGPFAREVGTR